MRTAVKVEVVPPGVVQRIQTKRKAEFKAAGGSGGCAGAQDLGRVIFLILGACAQGRQVEAAARGSLERAIQAFRDVGGGQGQPVRRTLPTVRKVRDGAGMA
jgi:hypothetical protein